MKTLKILSVILAWILLPILVPVCAIIDAWKWGCSPIYFDGWKGCPLCSEFYALISNTKDLFE